MKKTYYFYAACMYAVMLAAVITTSCSDMDNDYEKYFLEDEHIYAARVDSVAPRPGRQRILLEMFVASYRVSTARVFWNNGADSLDFAINGPGKYEALLENMQERSYIFQIISFDEFGNKSLPVEVSSRVYGDSYQARLVNRVVRTTTVDKNGNIIITFGEADISGGAYASEIKYTDMDGNPKVQSFPADEPTAVITDLMPYTTYAYRTVYLPDSLSIDPFYTEYAAGPGKYPFDKKDWSIVAFSSQHGGNDNKVANLIDGTDATRWHSLAGGSSYPHYATIDMGAVRTVAQFGVWITTFESPGGDHRAPDRIQFLISTDNATWTDLGEYDLDRFLVGEQTYDMPAGTQGRYFRFVGVSGPENNMVMGEISAY